jgi:two-component system LytT family response regulator
MKLDRTIDAVAQGPSPNGFAFAAACAAVIFTAYAVTLGVARELTLLQATIASAANTIPTMLFGVGAYWLVRTQVVGRPWFIQLPAHLIIGAAFALLTYWLITVMLGVAGAASIVQFTVRPFPHPASAWQLLQNLTTYGVFAALAYIHARPASATVALPQLSGERASSLSRYFIKSGDDFIPMDVDKIVSISGADDYCEVATLDGRHLARMTLAEFEQALDPSRFIRVHRSRIISVQHVQRAEPAGGGRLLVHMENGESIPASRSGSKRLRDLLL